MNGIEGRLGTRCGQQDSARGHWIFNGVETFEDLTREVNSDSANHSPQNVSNRLTALTGHN
jgi:hypothetical protein